jgi:hypothetical protein
MTQFYRRLAATKRYWLGPGLIIALALVALLLLGRDQNGSGLFQYKLF